MWGWISGGKGGPALNLPVNVGEETGQCLAGRSVFRLHLGTNKSTNDPVSVFKFEAGTSSTPEQKAVAKSEFKRLRVLRHPNIVKYLDGVDSDTVVVIVTEPVIPLLSVIQGEGNVSSNAICWGLYQVITGLKFLHEDCKIPHRNLYTSSIFVSRSGEWKIGGVGFCEENSPLPFPSRVNQYLSKYDPPEVLRGVNTSPFTTDTWLLGVLIWEVFNGNMSSAKALRDTSRIPGKLVALYRELVSSNYKSRPTVDTIFSRLNQMTGYFDNNFVAANIFLSELTIKDAAEKQRFFAQLAGQLEDFPPEFCKYKILPGIITTFQYGDLGIDVLPTLFKLGKLLTEEEYKTTIIPCIIKLFSSTDRGMRIQLLTQLHNFIEYLDDKTVDQQIFPAVSTGFTDTVPGMREHTVKSMLQIASRLSQNTIDNQLLKFLAKAQTDPEPPIRTNTTICISKVACHFSDATRRKVLIPAFLRALKDPFQHARNAGLLSLSCTSQYYYEPDIAGRILPAICPLLIDHDKMVREQALKTAKLFMEKIENHYKGVVEKPSPGDQPGTKQQPEQEAQGGWTSWAVSSVSNIATKYTQQGGTDNKVAEITKPAVSKPAVSKPAGSKPAGSKPAVSKQSRSDPHTANKTRPAAQEPQSNDEESGWDDGWDDISTPSLPKTKSSMKLGGLKSKLAPDDDDSFIASILLEEQQQKKKQPAPARAKSPESFKSTPAPWDVEKPPQNNKVKLTPWDEPKPATQNQDLLSSYFASNNSDFFADMGVDSSKSRDKPAAKSEWDDFNLKVTEPASEWDDWSQDKPAPPRTLPAKSEDEADWGGGWDEPVPAPKPSKPAFKPVQKSASPAFKPVQKSISPAFKPVPKSASPAQKSASPAQKSASPAQKSASPAQKSASPAQKSASPAQKSASPAQKSASPAFDSWGDSGWNDTAPPKKASSFRPVKSESQDDWGSGWDEDKTSSREEKRRQQRERRGNQRIRGGLGGVRKAD